MMRRILVTLSFLIASVVQIGAVSAAGGADSCNRAAAVTAAEALVENAVINAQNANIETASLIATSFNEPTALTCSLCFANCISACMANGASYRDCAPGCRRNCPGEQCEP